jgi:hypothetical protein
MSFSEHRQFERFPVLEDAVAYSQSGSKLGQVIMVGGGGMAIHLEDEGGKFAPGDRLQITVVEPSRNLKHTMEVTVVYLREGSLGLEFV